MSRSPLKMSGRANTAVPGDIFGEIAILDLERTADAVTLEDTNVLVIERRDFLPILEDNANLLTQDASNIGLCMY